MALHRLNEKELQANNGGWVKEAVSAAIAVGVQAYNHQDDIKKGFNDGAKTEQKRPTPYS